MAKGGNRYSRIIEAIFSERYTRGAREVAFSRDEIVDAAKRLGIELPKNLGDVLYSFRYRADLPERVRAAAPSNHEWIIRPAGKAQYRFVLARQGASTIIPSTQLTQTKVLDATPGLIGRYALSDEQALLAKLRYNRLIDVFTGLVCYSLQNHLRTTVRGMGQVETDEIYVGIDKRGVHHVIPVQGKGGKDRLGVVQIEQDFAVCASKFPGLVCRPVAAQFMDGDLIALFEFEQSSSGVKIAAEKHYRLVQSDALSLDELAQYQRRAE